MQCQECGKREATCHTQTNIDGIVNETHLCAECRAAFAPDMFKGIGGLLGMLGGVAEQAEREKRKRMVCRECGTTFEDFRRSGGYLGCGNCYREFVRELMPVILQTQGKTRHTGKIPNPSPEDLRAAGIRRLTAEFNAALEAERYEECAKLKREIERLQKSN